MRQQILRDFSVQPIENGMLVAKSSCVHVEAMGPVQAAEQVVGETLSVTGAPEHARAVVWSLAEDFTPVAVTLYSQVMA